MSQESLETLKTEEERMEKIAETEEDIEDDKTILAPKYKKANPETDKRKKPRSEAQIKAFQKARAIREENRIARKKIKDEEAQQKKKQIEEKIVKTAVRVKKRQVIKEKLIEEILSSDSDSEPEIQAVKKYVKKKQQKKEAKNKPPPPIKQTPQEKTKPKIIFR